MVWMVGNRGAITIDTMHAAPAAGAILIGRQNGGGGAVKWFFVFADS
jgi:hypothetical protein